MRPLTRSLIVAGLVTVPFHPSTAGVHAGDIIHTWNLALSVELIDKKPAGDEINPLSGPDSLVFKSDHTVTNDVMVSGEGKWKFDSDTKRWKANLTEAADLHYAHYATTVKVKAFKLKKIRLTNQQTDIHGNVRGRFKCTDMGVGFITKVHGEFVGDVAP